MPASSAEAHLEWERRFFRTAGFFLEVRMRELSGDHDHPLLCLLGEMDARSELHLLLQHYPLVGN